jgi:S1-C subfamily serine protease
LVATKRDRWGRVRLGDIIVEIGGQPIRTTDDVWLALDRRRAGERVEIEVVRQGERLRLEVVLGAPARR